MAEKRTPARGLRVPNDALVDLTIGYNRYLVTLDAAKTIAELLRDSVEATEDYTVGIVYGSAPPKLRIDFTVRTEVFAPGERRAFDEYLKTMDAESALAKSNGMPVTLPSFAEWKNRQTQGESS